MKQKKLQRLTEDFQVEILHITQSLTAINGSLAKLIEIYKLLMEETKEKE